MKASLERRRADGRSILHLYRRLLALRRTSRALREGSLTLCDAPDGVIVYERARGDERWVVAINCLEATVPCGITGSVVVASDGVGEGGEFSGSVAPHQAVALCGA